MGRKSLEGKSPDWKDQLTLQIGCLVFIGDLVEAQNLYNSSQQRLSESQKIRSRFYLGIGYVRRSQYIEGTRLFAKNLYWINQHNQTQSRTRFYAFQGAAFLNFFKGHYDRSLSLAQKALENALNAHYTYGEVLSLDLIAHAHCQLGKVWQGLHEFKKGIKLIRELGNGGLETALRISELRYRAQFGINSRGMESELLKALKILRPEETYSRAELYLELVRQLVLRGRVSEGQRILDESSDLIYRHQNRRQSALFNHRYAHILFLRGESFGALALLRSSISQLDPRIDSSLLVQFRGLENKILRSIGKDDLNYQRLPVTAFDERVRNRANERASSQLKGEDPLADLFDELHEKRELLIPLLLERDYLGVIPEALGMNVSGKKIYLGPERGQMILISFGDVRMVSNGLTTPLLKLLRNLGVKKFQSKSSLIKSVWGYNYDPSIHDNVLYTNIARLRSLLAVHGDWIEWSAEGYRLSPEVSLIDPACLNDESPQDQRVNARKERDTVSVPKKILLNLRQIQTLQFLEAGGNTDVSRHAKEHKVTKMTAHRDLSDLLKRRLITRVGRARATKYIGIPK